MMIIIMIIAGARRSSGKGMKTKSTAIGRKNRKGNQENEQAKVINGEE